MANLGGQNIKLEDFQMPIPKISVCGTSRITISGPFIR